jgi:hypothetical protein
MLFGSNNAEKTPTNSLKWELPGLVESTNGCNLQSKKNKKEWRSSTGTSNAMTLHALK